MKRARRWLLRLAVIVVAAQAAAFVVPAAGGLCASERPGGGCTCCRSGSGRTCPMCRQVSGVPHKCTCGMESGRHDEELPWLLGIAAIVPSAASPVVTLAPVAAVSLADVFRISCRFPPPVPPPRA